MRIPALSVATALTFNFVGCSTEPAPDAATAPASLTADRRAATVVDDAAMGDETSGENWLAFGRTYSEQRFSPISSGA